MPASLCIFLEFNLTAHWRCIDLWSRDVHWILGDGQHASCTSNRDLIILVVQRSVQFPGICWIFEQYLNYVRFSNFVPPRPPLVTVPLTQIISTDIYIWGYSFSPFPLSGHKSMKYDPKKKKQYCRQGGLPNETNGSAMTEQICKKINHIFWFRGLRLAGEELRNITSGVSRLSGEVGRLKAAAEPIIRLDRERPLAPTLDQLKGALANLVRGLKSEKYINSCFDLHHLHSHR